MRAPWRGRIAGALALMALACPLIAGQPEGGGRRAPGADAGLPTIDLSPAVTRLLEAGHLDGDERGRVRLRHGQWTVEDLADGAARAEAALQVGAIEDESLLGPGAGTIARARGMIARGELEEALEALGDSSTIAALRLRGEALSGLGRFDEADGVLGELVASLARERLEDADALSEGVLGLLLRERIGGTRRRVQDDQQARSAVQADFQTMTRLLARARDEIDRLSWRARLAEATILFEKHNRAQGIEAALEALRLNPRLAEAWALLGEHFVDTFDFDRAIQIADHLDALHAIVLGTEGGSSPTGDLIRARERLRQSDPGRAIEILDALLERFPRMRRAIALRAAGSAAAFDDAGTERWLARYEDLSPGAPEALFAVGRQLSEDRQYARAAEFLERAHGRLRTWPEPIIELGLLEVQSGRDARAREALVRAVRLDPFNARADNSLRLIEELLTYATIESEHFIIRYKPGIDEVLAREMVDVLEGIHDRVAGPSGIDHQPEVKTVIELMPDHRWFSVRITGMTGVHTMAAATGPVIALESPREGPNHLVGEYDWARVLQHEYTHTVTLSRTNNRIPHWFTEAAAVYLEDKPRGWDWCVLLASKFAAGELFDLKEINVRFVRPIEATDRTQAYAQGHWMYEHMVRSFGPEAPLLLMDEYAKGRSERDAMRDVLGIEPAAFMAGFLVAAEADLRAWGMLLPDGTPSLADLRRERSATLPEGEPEVETPRDVLEGWLAQYPGHPEVLEALLGRVLEGGPVGESDVALLEALAQARPVDPRPRMRLTRYYLNVIEGITDVSARPDAAARRADAARRAIEHLQWLDAREEHSPAYASELARQHAALGEFGQASRWAKRATMIAPFDAALREQAAQMALLAGDRDAARRHIEALIAIEPDREIHAKRLEALDRLRG